jgi:zinc transport system substrate-binding protein
MTYPLDPTPLSPFVKKGTGRFARAIGIRTSSCRVIPRPHLPCFRARKTVTRLLGCIAVLAAGLHITASGTAAAAPRVVVTVKPLHSLIAGVMEGVGVPDLVIRGAGSPHTYSLRPSEARLLDSAQVIFWVGESLETFLQKPLSALGRRARIVAAMRMPGVRLLPGRRGGSWEGHAGEDEAGHGPDGGEVHGHPGEHGDAAWDGHLWLDPANARAIVRAAADVLGESDPPNRGRYAANADKLVSRIDALDAELRGKLAPVSETPFVVFHDAYQYFEKAYELRAEGSIVVSPDRAPGARRVREMQQRIRSLGARCVFSEPQFPPAIIGTLLEGTGARMGTLDPLGADLPAGPDAWFALMRGLGSTLVDCLR